VPAPFNQGRNSTTINPALDDVTSCVGCTVCSQASWYYVDANDVPIGDALVCTPGRDATGVDRYFRVPAETQDTVCYDCIADVLTLPLLGTDACHWLHNTAVNQVIWPNPAGNVLNVRCYQYYLNSVITYTFTDAGDTVPPTGGASLPSLKWDVRTISGTVIHLPT